ncbi:MAG: glycosyltransferase family 2 protein [Bacteroidales bacterium]|nr:glycosyltransferase family 2 protein [Bacteroidales bacterium]
MDVKLTILIPTYNREQGLKSLLKNLQSQGHTGEYKIVVSDNHSDYDVQQMVSREFDSTFADHITVNSWNFNIGMSSNISVSYLLVNTEWCWIISDDDEIMPHALDTVLGDIERFACSDVIAVKYSLKDKVRHEDRSLKTLDEFMDYYDNDARKGELYYLSMLVNMEKAKKYLVFLTEYSYTYISFLIPLIKGLQDGKHVFVSQQELIKYSERAKDNWSAVRYVNVMLGVRTFADIDFALSSKQEKRLLKIVSANLPLIRCTSKTVQQSNRFRRKLVWKNSYFFFKRNSNYAVRLLCRILYLLRFDLYEFARTIYFKYINKTQQYS